MFCEKHFVVLMIPGRVSRRFMIGFNHFPTTILLDFIPFFPSNEVQDRLGSIWPENHIHEEIKGKKHAKWKVCAGDEK
jgi:hypothetical protein